MIITKKAIPRRTMLKGLGASLALPLLDGMVPAFTPLRLTAANPVRRLGIVYVPNGMIMDQWTPASEGTEFEYTRILKPLEPHRHHVQLLCHDLLARSPGRGVAGMPLPVRLAGAPHCCERWRRQTAKLAIGA